MAGRWLETTTRRTDLCLVVSLALASVMLSACGESTGPKRRSVATDAALPPNASTSWVNGGSPGPYCLDVFSQDSTTFPLTGGHSGWYYCPNQSTGFASPDGYASLYLATDPLNPGSSLTEEAISVVRGSIQPTSYNPDGTIATFTRTDSLTCDGGGSLQPIWTGTTTQSYVRKTYRCCSRYVCNVCTTDSTAGGRGTLTANQPPPPPPPPPAPVASVTVSPESSSVAQGQMEWLTPILTDSAGNPVNGATVTWATSNASVATVDTRGLVTGVAPGIDTITATSEGQSGSAIVTVLPESPSAIQQPSFSVQPRVARRKRP